MPGKVFYSDLPRFYPPHRFEEVPRPGLNAKAQRFAENAEHSATFVPPYSIPRPSRRPASFWRICQRSMPDTKMEAGRWHFGKARWPSIRNPRSSTLAVPGQYRRLVKIWPGWARMSIHILHFIGLRRQPLTRPSAFAKASAAAQKLWRDKPADRPATLSPSDGGKGEGPSGNRLRGPVRCLKHIPVDGRCAREYGMILTWKTERLRREGQSKMGVRMGAYQRIAASLESKLAAKSAPKTWLRVNRSFAQGLMA